MSELEVEYRLDYFEEEGFYRKQCPMTGVHLWTRDPDRETCGEPPADDYTFIDNPGFDEEYTLEEMHEKFLSFFKEHDHERIDPYPVAANRWRDDVLLTQASIYDFQPLTTSGEMPPPANPLTVSQLCIRMWDIDNVGKTGRHTMASEVMAHHAFNAREGAGDKYACEGEVYWKGETVRLCDEFFESLGADISEITYIEDPWVGGGNTDPAFKVLYRGAELATLVFMSMKQDLDGDYELKDGNAYSPMDTYIVDTGYGLERRTWVSQGTPTVYEAIYPDMIEFLKNSVGIEHTDEEEELIHRAAKLSGHLDIDEIDNLATARAEVADELGIDEAELTSLLRPFEDIHATADHCRTLAYILGNGIVPSNVGTGYLTHVVLRRTKRLVDNLGVDAPLDELVDIQAERLDYQNRDTIRDIVRSEKRKYRKTLERSSRKIQQLADDYADTDEPVPLNKLIELYDSHGIQPDMVQDIAEERGATVDISDDSYSLAADRHKQVDGEGEADERDDRLGDLPVTDKLYYDDQERTEFEAIVLDVFGCEEGYDVVLDQTMPHPEGGGQPADHGSLATDDATVEMTDVQIVGDVVLHRTDGDPDKGELVRGQLDTERRRRFIRHHTATHAIGRAIRTALGDHIRQAGAPKGTDRSRLDVTHYGRITREEVTQIERVVNEIVMRNIPVKQERPDRRDVEKKYGFDLYQGGILPGEQIRLIHVDSDVQACGGTHVKRTGDIGAVKVLTTEPVQGGVERVVFAAGDVAVETIQRTEDALYGTADVLDVNPADVPETAERFFTEWRKRGKTIDRLRTELAEARAAAGADETDIDGTPAVVQCLDGDADELRVTANVLVEKGRIAVLDSAAGGSAQFVVGVPDDVGINAGQVVGQLTDKAGGGDGGPADFVQGGGPDVGAFDGTLDEAPDVLRTVLNA